VTPAELFGNMTDPQRLEFIAEVIGMMAPEFKNEVIRQLAGFNAGQGDVQLKISSNAEMVRMDFGKPLAWFVLPKAHALQLGVVLIEHAEGRLEKSDG
jgi:hypothetical protein